MWNMVTFSAAHERLLVQPSPLRLEAGRDVVRGGTSRIWAWHAELARADRAEPVIAHGVRARTGRVKQGAVASLLVAAFVSVAHANALGNLDTHAAPVQPVNMIATPGAVLRLCLSSRVLAPACPHRLPFVSHLAADSAYTASLCRIGRRGCAGLTWDDLQIEHGGQGDHPPAWAHISIAAGRIIHSRGWPFAYPTQGPSIAIHDGLFAEQRPAALFLGRLRIRGNEGTLVLAPSYPHGGMEGDHLIFRWTHGSVEYMISLHAWEPLKQAFATLRTIVDSATGA
jgi:hypothetical protein